MVLDLDQGSTVGMAHARDVHETPILGFGPEPRIARSAPGFFFEGLGSAGLEYRVLTPPDASPTCAAWLISRVFTVRSAAGGLLETRTGCGSVTSALVGGTSNVAAWAHQKI